MQHAFYVCWRLHDHRTRRRHHLALPHVAAPQHVLRRPLRDRGAAHRAVRHGGGRAAVVRVRGTGLPRRGPPPPVGVGRGLAAHGPDDPGGGGGGGSRRPPDLPRPDRPRLLHGQRPDGGQRPHLRDAGAAGEPGRPHGPAPGHPEHPGRVGRPLRGRGIPLQRTPREGGGGPGPARLAAAARLAPPTYDIHKDTYDGTHPSASGEHKLAAAFADAMHQGWGLGGAYAR